MLQFKPGLEEGQDGFCPLIFIGSIRVQAIPAAAGRGIVEGLVQVVPAQEPLERAARFLAPTPVAGGPKCLQTSRHRRLGFHGLLIEAGTFTPLRVEAVRSDRDEMAPFGISMLQLCQPG